MRRESNRNSQRTNKNVKQNKTKNPTHFSALSARRHKTYLTRLSQGPCYPAITTRNPRTEGSYPWSEEHTSTSCSLLEMDLCFLFSQLLGVKGEELVPSFKLPEPIVMTSLGRREGEEERSVGPAPTASRLLPSVLPVPNHTVIIAVSTHPVPQGSST